MATGKGGLLCVGIDDGHVKACLCDQVSRDWRLVSWLAEQTPLVDRSKFQSENKREAVSSIVLWVMDTLGQFMDCDMRHALLPKVQTSESGPVDYQLDRVLLTACVGPPLKVWVLTLSPLWLPMLEEAIHAQSAHVVGVTLLQSDLPAWRLREEMRNAQPHLLLICGGYEGEPENKNGESPMISLLTECLALYENPLQIIYAGQSALTQNLRAAFQSTGKFDPITIPNISPQPEYLRFGPLQEALSDLQDQRDIQEYGKDAALAWGQGEGGPQSVSASFIGGLRVWQGRTQPNEILHGLLESAGRRLHVLLPANAKEPAMTWHCVGKELPDQLKEWPPVGLVSGMGPSSFSSGKKPVLEPKGFLPLIAPLFARDPAAAWSILTQDLLVDP